MTLNFKNKNWALIGLLYFLIFIAYYFPFIYLEILPGKIDSWFNLGIFKHYSNLLDHFFFGKSISIANYPEGKIFLHGESTILSGGIFWLLDKLFKSDLTSYLAFYIFVQSFNSFSFALFIKSFLKTDYFLAFAGGLFFSLTAFNMAFYDNIVYSIWFPIFFGLVFHIRMTNSSKKFSYALITAICLYAQLYFSVYNFFMGFILFATFLPLLSKTEFSNYKHIGLGLLLLLPVAFPFIYYYGIHTVIPQEFNDYISLEIIDELGFHLTDLYRSFKSNFIYGNFSVFQDRVNDYWKVGNLGILSILLALFGLFKASKPYRWWLLTLIIIGLTLSFGPFWGDWKSPTFYLYSILPFLKQFKLIFKFYYLFQIAIIVSMVIGIQHFFKQIGSKKNILIIGCIIFFVLENIPLNITEYSTSFELPHISESLLDEMKSNKQTTLFLPMCAPTFPDKNDQACFIEGRAIEFKYLFWQAYLNINVLNGSNGTIPKNRLEINQLFDNNTFEDAILQLEKSHNLKYIYFDKSVSYTFDNPSIDHLKKIYQDYTEDKYYVIFEF